ncbi:proteolipid protein 2-like [Molossus molossus]|uniref:proteolipid protein 2-like n=1 Tax=Molossus molossus TaxID=27622 RepID=UPI0017477B05|nr:proteolipid protein 2-like [Molossus molossus]
MADSSSPRHCCDTCVNFSRTQRGFLLLAEMILCLVILIAFRGSKIEFFSLSGIEFNFAVLDFMICVYGLHKKSTCLNWSVVEFIRSFSAALLYLILSIPDLAARGNSSIIIQGIVGLLATFLFGYDAFYSNPFRQ